MDFFDVVKKRCSMRAFRDQPVEPQKLQQILESLNRAPSAGNMQAYEVYVVASPSARQALSQAARDQEFIRQAPLALVFCTHPALNAERYRERGRDLYALQDATIACTFAMLAAAALGLDSVWVGSFDEARVSSLLGLPPDLRPIAILPVGYAGEEPQARSRRPLADLVHYGE